MKEIFTSKGYHTGSHYKKNGIQYSVVKEGRSTSLSITQFESGSKITKYYCETAKGIFEVDEAFLGFVGTPLEQDLFEVYEPHQLTETESEELHKTVSKIVNIEAINLKLPQPEKVRDRTVIFLKLWQKAVKGVDEAGVLNKFQEISALRSIEIIKLSAEFVGKFFAYSKKAIITPYQANHVFNWMLEEELEQKHITSAGEIIAKYEEIKNLTENHQIGAIENLGLTIKQAEEISSDQFNYLANICQDGETDEENSYEGNNHRYFTHQEMREEYEKIRELVYGHQLAAFNLGLTLEQTKTISLDQYNYLEDLDFDDHDNPKEDIRKEYETIIELKESYQLDAFDLGLTLESAKLITQTQFKYLKNFFEESEPVPEEVEKAYQEIRNLSVEAIAPQQEVSQSPRMSPSPNISSALTSEIGKKNDENSQETKKARY